REVSVPLFPDEMDRDYRSIRWCRRSVISGFSIDTECRLFELNARLVHHYRQSRSVTRPGGESSEIITATIQSSHPYPLNTTQLRNHYTNPEPWDSPNQPQKYSQRFAR